MDKEKKQKRPKPNVCVAIPLKTGARKAVKYQVNDCIKKGAAMIEFRIDYYNMVANFPLDFLEFLVEVTPVDLILTMRSPAEGGKTEIDEQERFKIIEKLIRAKPTYVDVEAQLDKKNLEKFYNLSKEKGVNLIYSYHNFKNTPPLREINDRYEDFKRKCPGMELNDTPHLIKMIFLARSYEDNGKVFKLCERADKENIGLISFCMGVKGKKSRVFCVDHGAKFTYASIGEKTAPGQVSISKFMQIYSKGEKETQ